MRTMLWAATCLLLLTPLAVAQNRKAPAQRGANVKHGGPNASTACGSNPVLIPDGFPVEDFVSANTTNYYYVNLKDGHSYALEAWDPFDTWNLVTAQLSVLSFCSTGPTFTDVASYDPDLSSTFSDRISWIQTGDAGEQMSLFNSDTGTGYSYFIRLVDTTLHNPRWSTFSGYTTQYGFLNNSNQDISGTLTVRDITGPVHTLSFTVPAGKTVFKIIGPNAPADIIVPAQHSGSSSFAFVGPPGAITADSYFVGSAGVIPGLFIPRNSEH